MDATSQTAPEIRPHSLPAKLLHWGFVALFAYGLTKQLDTVDQLEDVALLRFEMLFAAVFLIVLILRYIYMKSTRPSALPKSASRQMRQMARAGHLAIYASLSLTALSGMAIGSLYWAGVKQGLAMDMAIGAHEMAVQASYATIGLHIAAALLHRFKGDGIWSAMVPIWKELPRRRP